MLLRAICFNLTVVMPFFSVPSVADQTSFNFTQDGFRDGRLCDSGRLRVEASFPPEVPFIPSGNSILFLRRFRSFPPDGKSGISGGKERNLRHPFSKPSAGNRKSSFSSLL